MDMNEVSARVRLAACSLSNCPPYSMWYPSGSFDANNSIRITYTNFIEFCQFGEWAYEKLAVLDCNSGNVAVISPDRRLQTTGEIEIFLSGHCGYHLSEINWMAPIGRDRG